MMTITFLDLTLWYFGHFSNRILFIENFYIFFYSTNLIKSPAVQAAVIRCPSLMWWALSKTKGTESTWEIWFWPWKDTLEKVTRFVSSNFLFALCGKTHLNETAIQPFLLFCLIGSFLPTIQSLRIISCTTNSPLRQTSSTSWSRSFLPTPWSCLATEFCQRSGESDWKQVDWVKLIISPLYCRLIRSQLFFVVFFLKTVCVVPMQVFLSCQFSPKLTRLVRKFAGTSEIYTEAST